MVLFIEYLVDNTMKTILIFLLFTAILSISCKSTVEPENEIVTKEAIVIWEGDYAVDGCGFSFEIDSEKYKPKNEDFISDEFKKEPQTQVKIQFIYLNKQIEYYCGWSGIQKSDGIEIISISKL